MRGITDYLKENSNFLADLRPDTVNKCDLVSINEMNAKRMLDSHTQDGYIVISPCRGMQEMIATGEIKDLGGETSQKQRDEFNRANKERIRSLIYEIKKLGYSYTPVYGGFIENKGTDKEETVFERSFIIYCRDRRGNKMDFSDLFDFGIRMCRAYNQDSFLVQYPDGGRMAYVTKDGKVEYEFSGKSSFNDMSQEYFTDLHKYHTNREGSKLTRITFESVLEGVYVNPSPQGYSERHTRWLDGEVFV